MDLRSLSFRTDLIFSELLGNVSHDGENWIVKEPKAPSYYWGNFLYRDHPPKNLAEFRATEIVFRNSFADIPGIFHVAIGWHNETIEVLPETQRLFDLSRTEGYEVTNDVVLRFEGTIVEPEPRFTIKALESDSQWQQSRDLAALCDATPHVGNYGAFVHQMYQRYGMMVAKKRGQWLGAYDGDTLVGQMGLIWSGNLGRFQAVETHPGYRCRGVCTALLRRVLYEGHKRGLENFVIVAREKHVERIYERVGFTACERQVGVHRSDAQKKLRS